MQETNIIARVIQTLPQSFIEANIEKLCYAITGINPLNNKNVSLTFLNNGGFEFINLEAQTSNRFIGPAFKDKNDVLTKLNDFLRKRNEIISQSFKNANNDFSFPFFPTQYMKPIAVFPNYEKGKFGRMIRSWTVTYKIEINAYDNPTTGRYEYANVINSGIEITASSGGYIIGLKYNLLPLESRKGSPLFNVVADENETPQLAYLLNKETNSVAPFYLATAEEAYIPATRESILPGTSNSSLNSFNNPTNFDRNRIVVWLKRIGINRKLKVKDSSSLNNTNNSNVVIPVGTKVIRLKPNSESDENTPCFFWWQGCYHQSSLPEQNLGNNNVVISNLSGKVLQNDIEHLLNRIASYEKKQTEFDAVIKSIKDFSKTLLSKKQIEDGLVAIATNLKLNAEDKPATINRLRTALFQIYDPAITTTENFSDESLILPLSETWFKSDTKLLERYNTIWLTSSSLGNRFEGFSGEGVSSDPMLSDIKTELLQLKDFVNQTTAKDSPEAKWLQTLTSTSLNDIKRIIFLCDNTWKLGSSDRYAEFIAIENSFGAFKLPPLLNVIIHELTVNSSGSFLPFASGSHPDGSMSDSHIPDYDTKETWEKANKGELGNIEKNQDFIDHLYQSHKAYASIALGIIIHEISHK